MKTVKKLFVMIYRAIAIFIVSLAAALLVLLLFGIHPYVVKTGSMEPEIEVGSICFVDQRSAFGDVREGDIIAFRVGEMLVTHRAVRISEEGITTQGDANNTEDAEIVTDGSYIGRTLFWIPQAGKILLYARYPEGKIAVAGAFVLFVLCGIIYDKLSSAPKEEQRESKEEKEEAAAGGGH